VLLTVIAHHPEAVEDAPRKAAPVERVGFRRQSSASEQSEIGTAAVAERA
jgi:hypothetical protein